jgi:ubiquinone/menaquinone biosynthesis C-methylase UbiE
MSTELELLPHDSLVTTSDIDKAAWNFQPVLGYISRQRFHMALSLLGKSHVPRLLEIGYGSGIFMPALAAHCDELYGLDVHKSTSKVAEVLAKRGVVARLASGSAENAPYENRFFDRIVAVSAFEFVDIAATCIQIKRILKPQGELIVVSPGHSAMLDFGLKVLTGTNAEKDFQGRRNRVLPTLKEHFDVLESNNFPRLLPSAARLYTALKLRRKPAQELNQPTEHRSVA